MTDQPPFDPSQGRPPTEEELRAAYEQQLKQLRVEDLVLETLVSLINLGGRRAGLAQGAEDERDPEQLRVAIEGARALLPLVEDKLGPNAEQIRQALSQLQMAYVQLTGGAPAGGPESPGGPGSQGPGQGGQQGGTGPAQSSGRLWVPGQ